MIIKRGILQSFNAATYTASVLLFEATSYFLSGVPVSNTIDGTSAQVGALCAVLFFDEQNPTDAVVIATFGNGGSGIPSPAPGRITFVSGYRQINAAVINAGSTQSFQMSGNGGIPLGAAGILYKAYFTSPTANAYITICPHNPNDSNAYGAIGNLPAANGFLNGNGVIPLDASGQIDIFAATGNCTVWLYTYGYVM